MVYFTVFYYLLCVLFALLIYAVGTIIIIASSTQFSKSIFSYQTMFCFFILKGLIEPECVLFDGYALDDVTDWFDAVYTLSWTTFSTTVR